MPTDLFIPVTCLELSSGKATIYQDGSVTIHRLVLCDEDVDFACEEQRFPLSKQDLEKLTKALQLFAPHFSKENPL